MASSFTTSLGIEEMTTGEKTGTWGTITNFNWDIMDRIATYKAVAITTNADTATLTVREASPGTGTENLQDGMYRVIKFTGALDSDCTVTIAPNTTQVFFIVVNATTDSGSSGPYSVILSQGSGANITVENGKSAVVYCDGAGSGAAVIDALSNLQLATVTASGDITSSGTFNALGDTAADDKAAIGYTAAEGIIVTGQGSTNDVTIKNDADADVLEIPTGTTNVTVVGDITAGGTVGATGDTAAGDDAAIGYTAAEGVIITGQGSTSDITIKNDADADVLTVATGTTNVDIVGDVTASTVNADGDTSASDSAAMGYTAVEGLILTGQGSTNDVTIKNDADGDVISIPTGTTNVTIAGDLTISGDDLTMATNTSGAVLVADGTNYNPVVVSGDVTIGSDGAVTIANDAVSLAKMAAGTDGNLITYDASGDPVALAVGTSGQYLQTQGAGAEPQWASVSAGMTQDTAQSSASGTAIDFTGLPAGLTLVHILFEDVSLSGTDTVLIQLGDAGGFETSGYAGRGTVATVTPAIIYTSNSAGIATRMYESGYKYSGVISLMLQDAANTWVWGGTYVPEQDKMAWSAGNKTLSGELTQIRVTRSGSNTFDSGSINLLYM